MNSPAGDIVSKSEFASRLGVTKSAVSMWLKNGKLTGEALVGEGRSAQVRVDVALRQLRERVDPVLSLHKGLALPQAPAAAAAPAEEPHAAAPAALRPSWPAGASALPLEAAAGPASDAAARLQLLKVEQAERDAQRDRERLAAEAGRYVDAAEARKAWTREASAFVGEIERWILGDVGELLAARLGCDRAEVKALLRQAWRERRLALASEAASRAAAEPELVEDIAA